MKKLIPLLITQTTVFRRHKLMISIRYIPVILSGLVVVIGLIAFAIIRDNKMWDKLDQRNAHIEHLIEEAN